MMFPRLYPILDTDALERAGLPLVASAAAFLEGGAGILQFRHKRHWSRAVFEAAREVALLCREGAVPFVVNDRADVAALLHAGLHVGQDDLPPAEARKLLGPDALLGFSTHDARQLLAAGDEPVDYVAIGPVFATSSKLNPDPALGTERLRRSLLLEGKPVVAIGGVTRRNALEVLAAGADSVAVISDLLPENPTVKSLRERMEEWQRLLRT